MPAATAPAPVEFLPYQKNAFRLIRDHPVVVWEKSRRIGASYCLATYAVTHAALGRGNVVYMSYNKEMTETFLDDVRDAIKRQQTIIGVANITILPNDKEEENILKFIVKFAGDKTLRSVASLPKAFRSKGKPGDVFIVDEAAFVEDLDEILKAAKAVRMWGGKLVLLSTHNGVDNPYNALITDIRAGKFPTYRLHRTTLDDALNDGLHRKICEITKHPHTPATQEKWREELLAEYGDAADEELLCIPANADNGSWLSGPLIEARQTPTNHLLRWHPPTPEFVLQPDRTRANEIRAWHLDHITPIIRAQPPHNPWTIGVDFARKSDLSAITLLQRAPDLTRHAHIIELRDMPFTEQERLLDLIIQDLHGHGGCAGVAIDAGGNGEYLAERATQKHQATAIKFTDAWYRENMPPLKRALEDNALTLPKTAGVFDDFRAARLIRGTPRLPDLRQKDADGGKRHGDTLISTALALYQSRRSDGWYAPTVTAYRPNPHHHAADAPPINDTGQFYADYANA